MAFRDVNPYSAPQVEIVQAELADSPPSRRWPVGWIALAMLAGGWSFSRYIEHGDLVFTFSALTAFVLVFAHDLWVQVWRAISWLLGRL